MGQRGGTPAGLVDGGTPGDGVGAATPPLPRGGHAGTGGTSSFSMEAGREGAIHGHCGGGPPSPSPEGPKVGHHAFHTARTASASVVVGGGRGSPSAASSCGIGAGGGREMRGSSRCLGVDRKCRWRSPRAISCCSSSSSSPTNARSRRSVSFRGAAVRGKGGGAESPLCLSLSSSSSSSSLSSSAVRSEHIAGIEGCGANGEEKEDREEQDEGGRASCDREDANMGGGGGGGGGRERRSSGARWSYASAIPVGGIGMERVVETGVVEQKASGASCTRTSLPSGFGCSSSSSSSLWVDVAGDEDGARGGRRLAEKANMAGRSSSPSSDSVKQSPSKELVEQVELLKILSICSDEAERWWWTGSALGVGVVEVVVVVLLPVVEDASSEDWGSATTSPTFPSFFFSTSSLVAFSPASRFIRAALSISASAMAT